MSVDGQSLGLIDVHASTLEGATRAPEMLALTPSAEALFSRSDRYRLSAVLGSGGMGNVYKAHDLRLNRAVAIKLLRSDRLATENGQNQRRFEREARAQARIEHPHVCKIYEVGTMAEQPYIAMQFITGASLGELCQFMTREDKARIAAQVAEALHAAHQQGVIHRDIKPSNIMVEQLEDGRYWPYLMDFGLAREVEGAVHSSTAGVVGTPAYMAPEQARGETQHLDRRTDVYGLGATLYSVLCGRPPFSGNSTEVLLDVISTDPSPPRRFDKTMPRALETIVLKCLEKDPRLRYESAHALALDLRSFLGGSRIVARPASLPQRLSKTARRHKLLFASMAIALVAALLLVGVSIRARLKATEQAAIAQLLGQEIAKMEWLLRSARQMPLHDLNREKVVVRRRMRQLEAELSGYGALTRGLAHYALGRGHLALHEYHQALAELQAAMAHGQKGAEVQYALGLVLGRHFEQALYEARLSGGGSWAEQQLKELEPRYLRPAIASLSRSRAMKLEAPEYLEALLSFYQGDYGAALAHTEKVLADSPWMYEAAKLAGDVHHEQALRARDSGRYDEAQREFSAAVRSYEAAAAIGQSDAEVYEGLAETWVRQVEMQGARSQPTETAYAAAVQASDKLSAAEPQSSSGQLKKAFAAMMTMALTGSGLTSGRRIEDCLRAAETVLRKEPDNPYAREAAASCYASAAEQALSRGEAPEPLWAKALNLLEDALQRSPRFLWGLNDVGTIYGIRGAYRLAHGSPVARQDLERAMHYYQMTTSLDENYAIGWQNMLGSLYEIIQLSDSSADMAVLAAKADEIFAKCQSINRQYQPCYDNYAIFEARLARRQLQRGEDPRPALTEATRRFLELRALGGSYLDAEQHMALLYLVAASDALMRGQEPTLALVELQAALGRCFALVPQDAVCQTLAVQADWVAAEQRAQRGQPFLAVLEATLKRAIKTTQSPERYPEAWWALAETHLRLARGLPAGTGVRLSHCGQGLKAVERLLTINPNHRLGRVTARELRELMPERADAQHAGAAAHSLSGSSARDGYGCPNSVPHPRPAAALGRRAPHFHSSMSTQRKTATAPVSLSALQIHRRRA